MKPTELIEKLKGLDVRYHAMKNDTSTLAQVAQVLHDLAKALPQIIQTLEAMNEVIEAARQPLPIDAYEGCHEDYENLRMLRVAISKLDNLKGNG